MNIYEYNMPNNPRVSLILNIYAKIRRFSQSKTTQVSKMSLIVFYSPFALG